MKRIGAMLAAAIIAALAALAAPALGQEPASLEYRLGPKDLIEIKVLELAEMTGDRRVGDDGAIELPLVGKVPVSGLTASEVGERLQAVLTAKYVNRATVTVVIKDYANKPVSIIGAVQRPGALNIAGRWDLLQAISAAGGLRPDAGRKIYVLRRSENGISDRLEIDRDELFLRSSERWNVPIYPSDVVNIPPRTPVKIFCVGEVRSPGALEFDSDDRITLLSVIAKAGGFSSRAAKGSIRIKRRGADRKDVELRADYPRIVAGKDPDPELMADDVVIVKESFF
ncbi:MAG: polysaccharide biosynthesis/export family protein [Thermoanaerobaculia bacterium]|nr:polysaccharide biosynthesis/export family protein [Thermoanaerobaculia bacterium]